MIRELVEPNFVKGRAVDLADELKRRSKGFRECNATVRSKADEAGITLDDLKQAQQIVAKVASEGDFARGEEEAAWLPRDPYLSILQSTLHEFYVKASALKEEHPKSRLARSSRDPVTDLGLKPEWYPTKKRPFMRQTEESDWLGWGLSFAVAKAISAIGRKPPFREQKQAYPLQPRARLVLVGDWASGVRRAGNVAAYIAEQLNQASVRGIDRHVIHLGDVYYAGRDFEYVAHLGDMWPVKTGEDDRIGSWCLNGNHDMFSGGQALFAFLQRDSRFKRQNGCTHFALENKDWLIFGLDTAYESEGFKGNTGGLAAPQAVWIMERIRRAPDKKIILLSHHQPFSAWEGESPRLLEALQPVLHGPREIAAWFWGHEHRCAIYAPHFNVRYPSLIGHGGVPVYASSKEPKGPKVLFHDRRSFPHLLEKYAYLGFAVLDLDGPNATVAYIDENGKKIREGDTF